MAEIVSDEILTVRAKADDTAAFEELFHRYRKPILNFVYRMLGNKETAEEVAQEVFMKAYNNLCVFDPGRKFSTWLYTIAKNMAKNAIRDRKYFKDVSLEASVFEKDKAITLKEIIADPLADPGKIAEEEELEEAAQKVLNSLPPEYREVITLSSAQGLTYKEVAQILGCSVASVGMRLGRAKELFMKRLGIDADDTGKKRES